MNDCRVEVFQCTKKEGTSKLGKPYSMLICQCLVTLADGAKLIGELVLPKGHPEVKPGHYIATFEVQISQDKRIGGAVKQLTPVTAAAVPVGKVA